MYIIVVDSSRGYLDYYLLPITRQITRVVTDLYTSKEHVGALLLAGKAFTSTVLSLLIKYSSRAYSISFGSSPVSIISCLFNIIRLLVGFNGFDPHIFNRISSTTA